MKVKKTRFGSFRRLFSGVALGVFLTTGVVQSAPLDPENFAGDWTSKSATSTYYAADRVVDYRDCALNFSVVNVAATNRLEFRQLSIACEHPTYWSLVQRIRPFALRWDGNQLFTSAGEKVGTFDGTRLDLKIDADGEVLFLEAVLTEKGLTLEWSMRSFESLNFDVLGVKEPLARRD